MRAYPSPMFSFIFIGPFTKWDIDYTICHPNLARGDPYIIIAVEYFTKWFEDMPMFNNDGETTILFIFNQIVARLDIPKDIFIYQGSHF
jgi:hypothetical protein